MKHLLFDLDDTLIDFQKAEKVALPHLFSAYGLPMNAAIRTKYRNIVMSLWEQLKEGTITRQDLQMKRFEDTFLHFGLVVDGEIMDMEFRKMLANFVHVIEDAEEVVAQLAQKYSLHIVTNGVVETQSKKIEESKLRNYFNQVFISRETGFQKPDPEFFEHVLMAIQATPKECCIIGDSLFADIAGGNGVGMTTIWHNPRRYKNHTDILPDYEIYSLKELYSIL